MNIKLKPYIILLAIVTPIYFVFNILEITNTINTSMCGFSVDSEGNIYIGKDSCIEVYKEGVLTYKIDPMTTRGYSFTIENGNEIIVSNAVFVYTMDLNGQVLYKEQDINSETSRTLNHARKAFTDINNNYYKWVSHMGYDKIVCIDDNNEDIVYTMSLTDYISKVILGLSTILFVFCLLAIFVLYRNHKV